MVTNREKYIDSMTDKELALFLSCGSQIIDNQIDTNPSLTDDEKIRKQAARNCEEIEKWLSQEVELSADEMFKELGYKKGNRWCCECVFDRKNGDGLDRIVIDKTNYGYYYIKHRILYNKNFYEEYTQSHTISEAEDKAIHKKIDELKGE